MIAQLFRLRALLPVTLAGGVLVADPAWLSALPVWAQVAMFAALAIGSAVFQWIDTDHSMRISEAEAWAALNRIRDAVHKAKSPAAVALVAVLLTLATACGTTLYVRTSGAGLVEVGADGYPPLRVEGDAAADVWWTVGEPVATVETVEGGCVRVRLAGTVLAETCAEADGSGNEAP